MPPAVGREQSASTLGPTETSVARAEQSAFTRKIGRGCEYGDLPPPPGKGTTCPWPGTEISSTCSPKSARARWDTRSPAGPRCRTRRHVPNGGISRPNSHVNPLGLSTFVIQRAEMVTPSDILEVCGQDFWLFMWLYAFYLRSGVGISVGGSGSLRGSSLSIAARRLPQFGQKPRFASPSKVSYQVGSPPSPGPGDRFESHPPLHWCAAEHLIVAADTGVGEDGRPSGGKANAAAQAAAGTFPGCFTSLGVGGGGIRQRSPGRDGQVEPISVPLLP